MSPVGADFGRESTSSLRPMVPTTGGAALLVGLIAAHSGTSAAVIPVHTSDARAIHFDSTTVGDALPYAMPTADAISEIRRRSSFTSDQIARLCGVTRRTIHDWASGGLVPHGEAALLRRLLEVLRTVDRGSGEENRRILLSVTDAGDSPFDLLIRGAYEHVVKLVGPGSARPFATVPTHIPDDRLPPPPDVLLNALQDPIETKQERVIQTTPVPRQQGS